MVALYVYRPSRDSHQWYADRRGLFGIERRTGRPTALFLIGRPPSSRRAVGVGRVARAMSEENVEVVRQVFSAFNRGDWSAWESLHRPEMEWSDPPEWPGSGVHRGVDVVRRFIEEVLETGDECRSRLMPSRVSARTACLCAGVLYSGSCQSHPNRGPPVPALRDRGGPRAARRNIPVECPELGAAGLTETHRHQSAQVRDHDLDSRSAAVAVAGAGHV